MTASPITPRPNSRLLGLGWFLCATFFFYAFLQRVSPSVMVAGLMRDFAVSGAILGNLSAFYYYAYASSQIPVGVLLDRLGPRRLVTVALALVAVGSFVFAEAETLGSAYLGRLIIGLGCAFSFPAALNYAALWFAPHRFATLGGTAQMLGMIGGVAGQAPLGALVEAVGWRTAVLGIAGFGAVLMLASGLVLRDPPSTTKVANHGENGRFSGLKCVLATKQVWLASGFGMAMTSAMLAFGGLWGVPYLMQAYHLPKETAAALISLLFVGWGIGAPLSGWLADRFRLRRVFMVSGASLATLGITATIYLPHPGLSTLAVCLVVQGLGASSMVLAFSVVRENTPPWAAGTAIGVTNGFVVGSGAIFQPLLGWLLDLRWDGTLVAGARIYTPANFEFAFLVLPVIGVIGILCALATRETHGQPLVEEA